jgi:hypothetical protein
MENTITCNIKAGDLYKHFKGDYYKIVAIARDGETTDLLVIYQGFYDDKRFGPNPIWARPLEDFAGYKITDDGKKIKRFEKVSKVPDDYIGHIKEG